MSRHLKFSRCNLFILLATAAWTSRLQAQYTPIDLFTMNPPSGLVNASPGQYHATDNGSVVGFSITGGKANAVLWSANGTATNMNPTNIPGFNESFLQGIGGGQQVGYGHGTATGDVGVNTFNHALLWTGTSGSAIDLHPTGATGYTGSAAYATDGSHQVGYSIFPSTGGGFNHAMIWSGTAASAVDIHPTKFGSGYIYSWALGLNGNQQVGFMQGGAGDPVNIRHALLWTGTAASAIDLHPTINGNFFNGGSAAIGIAGGQEVGYASFNLGSAFSHAMLWTGTAASAVDLNPSGASNSFAYGTNGSMQVGYVAANDGFDTPHAELWSGTAASAVDLNALLGSNYRASTAYSINASGDVFGTAGDTSGNVHSVMWINGPHVATGLISGGTNQSATAAGRSPAAGDVKVSFSFAGAGTFSNTNSLTTAPTLASQTAPFNFVLPTNPGLVQTWDLSFDGSFTGPATLTFHFDPSSLAAGTDLSQLAIAHFSGGQWVTLPGTVDPLADTITVSSNTFSPFALVPEPSDLSILVAFLGGLMVRRRRLHEPA